MKNVYTYFKEFGPMIGSFYLLRFPGLSAPSMAIPLSSIGTQAFQFLYRIIWRKKIQYDARI